MVRSSASTLTITLTGTNDAPVAVADINSGNEDTILTGTVATSDSDVDDGAVLSYAQIGAGGRTDDQRRRQLQLRCGNAAYQHLADGATQVVVANYTVTDEHGASSRQHPDDHADRHQRRAGSGGRYQRGNEDTTITGTVAANDSDVDDGAVLSYAQIAPVAGLTLNADGSYSFDAATPPTSTWPRVPRRSWWPTTRVTDEHGASSASTLTITLTGTNDAPVAVADTNSGNEDTILTGTVATNDSDVDDGAVLSYAQIGAGGRPDDQRRRQLQLRCGNAAYQHLAEGATQVVVANYTRDRRAWCAAVPAP